MNRDDFTVSLKAKLETVFTNYQNKLIIPEQQVIVQRGFVFSKIDPSADVLVMGINPSLRDDFLNPDGYSYDYSKLAADRYFKKFPVLLKDFKLFGITYCDLFYQRHTEQKHLNHFLKDRLGRSFLWEQLQITREVIDYVSPKLILLFNRQGAQFFTPDWIGLTPHKDDVRFSSENMEKLFKISDRDMMIYFSAFLGYRTPKSTYTKLGDDLPRLFELLNH